MFAGGRSQFSLLHALLLDMSGINQISPNLLDQHDWLNSGAKAWWCVVCGFILRQFSHESNLPCPAGEGWPSQLAGGCWSFQICVPSKITYICRYINGIYIYTYKFMYIYIYMCLYMYIIHIYIYYTLHMKYIRYVSSMRILPADLWRPSCSWTTWRRWDGLPWRLGICRISPWQVFYVKDPSFASAFGVVWATKCWSLCTRFLGSHKSMVVVHMPLGVTRKIYRYAFLYTLYRPRIYIYVYNYAFCVYIYIIHV